MVTAGVPASGVLGSAAKLPVSVFRSTMYPGAPDGGAVQLNCTELRVAVVTVRAVGACNPWSGSKDGIRIIAPMPQPLSDPFIPLCHSASQQRPTSSNGH